MSIRCLALATLGLAFGVVLVGCGKGDDAASSMANASAPAASSMDMKDQSGSALSAMAQRPAPGSASTAGGAVNEGWNSPTAQGAPTSPKPNGGSPTLASYTPQRAVIRKANLAVRVKDIDKSDHELDKETVALGGYVDSASSTNLASDDPQMDVTVRIPAERFDEAITQFEALGVELSKSVSSEDVTGQLVDLDARLRTLGAEEETYRNILRKATKLDQVIALQDKLTEVRSEMESMASQRKTLGGLAALSTITVHFERTAEPNRAPADAGWLNQTWGQSTTQLGSVLRAGVVGGVWFLVFCPILIPIVWLARRAWRGSRRPSVAVTTVSPSRSE